MQVDEWDKAYSLKGPVVTQPPPPAHGIKLYGFLNGIMTPGYLLGAPLPPMLDALPVHCISVTTGRIAAIHSRNFTVEHG